MVTWRYKEVTLRQNVVTGRENVVIFRPMSLGDPMRSPGNLIR